MARPARKPLAIQSIPPFKKSNRLRMPHIIYSETSGRICNPIFSLPAEILDQVFYSLDYTERWCFALSCKTAARYAVENPTFLEVPTALTPTSAQPSFGPRSHSERIRNWRRRDVLASSKAYSDIMRILSIGWVDKQLHWCDHCRRFKPFPMQTRIEWYGGEQLRLTVEAMRKGGGWVQDIGLSVDGFIGWNHSCPPCARRWWKSVAANNEKVTVGKSGRWKQEQ